MKKYKFIGTKEEAQDYVPISPEIGMIYPENHLFNEISVLHMSKRYPDEWEEVFEEEAPTLESLTDQIKELAKKQGMNCNVVLEKKKEVEVDDFCAIHTNITNSISISVRVRNDVLVNVGSKESQIIESIKKILEND